MARPKGSDRDGKRIVLEAAVANFAERGYHGTSMRDIATSAQVTVASIYHHFPSKQEILQHLMVGTMSDLLTLTHSAAAAASGPTAQLGAVVETWVLFHTERRPEALIGASELRSLDDVGRARVVGLRDEQQALFRTIIDAGISSGDFTLRDGVPPEEAVRAIITMGYSIASWYRPDGATSPTALAQRYRAIALTIVGR